MAYERAAARSRVERGHHALILDRQWPHDVSTQGHASNDSRDRIFIERGSLLWNC